MKESVIVWLDPAVRLLVTQDTTILVLLSSKRSTRTCLVLLAPPVIRRVSPSLKPSSTKSLVPVIVVVVKVTTSVREVLKAAALTLILIEVARASVVSLTVPTLISLLAI